VYSHVMATMSTMATPKLKLKKNKEGCEVGVITTQLNSQDFFKRSAPRVAMVAIVAMGQKSLKVPC